MNENKLREDEMPTDVRIIEIGDGPIKRSCPQVFDDVDLPQCLEVGQKFVLREEARFRDHVYPKKTEVEFLGYVVRESVTLSGRVCTRHAVFRLSETHNGILTAQEIQPVSREDEDEEACCDS